MPRCSLSYAKIVYVGGKTKQTRFFFVTYLSFVGVSHCGGSWIGIENLRRGGRECYKSSNLASVMRGSVSRTSTYLTDCRCSMISSNSTYSPSPGPKILPRLEWRCLPLFELLLRLPPWLRLLLPENCDCASRKFLFIWRTCIHILKAAFITGSSSSNSNRNMMNNNSICRFFEMRVRVVLYVFGKHHAMLHMELCRKQ